MSNKMSSYECSKCGYKASVKSNANKHIKQTKCSEDKDVYVIENIVKVKCVVCGKEFNEDKLLTQHKKSCIEKKSVVVSEYVDSEDIKKSIGLIFSMLKEKDKNIEDLINENRELTKRIEKLENANKKAFGDEIKKGKCQYEKFIYLEELNRDTLLKIHKDRKCIDNENYNPPNFVLYGFKVPKKEKLLNGDVSLSSIETEDGTVYEFKNIRDMQTLKYCVKTKYCKEYGICNKSGKCYCEKHSLNKE